MTLLASSIAALCCTTDAYARNKAAAAPGFVTTAWVNLRQGPGTSWALLATIPPSTPVEVDFCSKTWTIGWCQVTYQGQTGSVHSSLLKSVGPVLSPKAERKGGYAEPAFLVQAERNYQRAQQAYEVQKGKLARLLQEEARLSRSAMARSGQWMEPTALWRRKVAEKQNLASLRQAAAQARAERDDAEIRARSMSNAPSSRAHSRRWSSWWRW
jgi:uncharacterized protein YgiM (DUF1202 family)